MPFNSTFKNPGKGLSRSGFARKPPKPKAIIAKATGEPVKAKPRKAMKASRPKAKTAAESDYMGRVARMGCIVCRNLGYGESPCELHHPRTGAGGGQRSAHTDVIGLCPNHHRLGGHGVAYHAGPEEFERRYGTELELMAQTRCELGVEQ